MDRKLSPEDMVRLMSVAPFEIAHAFKAWAEAVQALESGNTVLGGATIAALGAPHRAPDERPMEFGERMAAGLVHFLKES